MGEPKSYIRRDHMRDIEVKIQKKWENEKIYNVLSDNNEVEKYFVTFPYPYMNGRLHLGHAFSLTKAEFMARYQRLKGKNVLFPFGFHCTGMPIQSAANKLKKEIETYGNPPIFPKMDESLSYEKQMEAKLKYQWNILKMMNIEDNEISEFINPYKWLSYFPPFGVSDLKKFGVSVDWRRSFITTEVNPFYDAFVKWQFNTLYKNGYIKFGNRPSIYSIVDKQVCADHERSIGEGVNYTEYAFYKFEVKKNIFENHINKKVYIGAITKIPQFINGITNIFINPNNNYEVYELNDNELIITTEYVGKGLFYQHKIKNLNLIETINGNKLMGIELINTFSKYDIIYTLPQQNIEHIIVSIPSIYPENYIALQELINKPLYREKFNIYENMVVPYEPIQILENNSMLSVQLCEKYKIKSVNDVDKIKQSNEEIIKLYGKDIKYNDSNVYYEPEELVISRSGDKCIVALLEQWYLTYGEGDWKEKVLEHIRSNNFNTYNQEVKDKFESSIDWLHEWGCTRQFGLGTKLPWDEKWLIESLSDSSIYMAYYTISHLLQGENNLNGHSQNILDIHYTDLNDDAFNYIFLNKDYVPSCKIPEHKLQILRKEFEYWYPLDLRVSAKDLIPNHLTMSLYNHVGIWNDKDKLPKSIFCNGYIMIDSKKMSKSTGNFLMLNETIDEFSTDATRFALADAGDGMEDANFLKKVANSALMNLYNEEEWIKEIINNKDLFAHHHEFNKNDIWFMNQMNYIINIVDNSYSNMKFRKALVNGWFELQNIRDNYRDWANKTGNKMNYYLINKYIEIKTILISPIAPHYAENIWYNILNKDTKMYWPKEDNYDMNIIKEYEFFYDTVKIIRSCIKDNNKKNIDIYILDKIESNKCDIIDFINNQYLNIEKIEFENNIIKYIKEYVNNIYDNPKVIKKMIEYGAYIVREIKNNNIIEKSLPYDQKEVIENNIDYLKGLFNVNNINIIKVNDDENTKAILNKPFIKVYNS